MNALWRCGSEAFIHALAGLAPAVLSAQMPSSQQPLFRVEIGSGPATIVVLHGGPGLGHQYLRPEWDAAARHYRMVYYDQRGCGRSPRRGPFGWEQHVADLHELVSHYRRSGPVVLAGSSWGSQLALLYAWKHPGEASALILSGAPQCPIPSRIYSAVRSATWPMSPSYRRQMPDSLPPHLLRLWQLQQDAQHTFEREVNAWHAARLDSMLDGLLDLPTVDSATSARNRIAAHGLLHRRLGEHCYVVAHLLSASFQQEPAVSQLAAVHAPTLLIRGTGRNPVSDGADTLLRVLPNAQLISLAGTGHDPWLDWPDAFFAHVHRFLESRLPDPVLRPESRTP